jgi:opacity protein-like surface antigen
MTLRKLLLAGAPATLLSAGAASAQVYEQPQPYTDEASGFYLGGGYTFIDIETDNDISALDDQGDSTNALTVRAGYQITPVFGIEVDGTFGIDDGGFDLDGSEIDLSEIDLNDIGDDIDGEDIDRALAADGDLGLDYLFGVFGKVGFPVNERFSVSGRVGYAFAEIDVTNRITLVNDEAGVGEDELLTTPVTTITQTVGGSDDGFAFGASARYNLSDASAIRADYTRYNFGDANADAVTISYQYTFGGPGVGY